MSAPTVRERQRQVREDAILETARAILAKDGYEAMNMDDLAAQVGISKATLYAHFPSKDDVAANVICLMLRLAEQDIHVGFDPTQRAIEHLEIGLRRSLERRVQTWNTNLALPPSVVIKNKKFYEQHQHLSSIIAEVVELAKAQGDVDQAISTPVLVRTVLWLFRADYEDLLTEGKCTPEELVNTLVQMVINGSKPIHPSSDLSHPSNGGNS